MLNMVAPIYNNSRIALYIFQAIGIVLEKSTDFVAEDFVAQIFPQTATWGLKYWEKEYGIITDESLSLEQRRNNLMSTMKYKAPITPKKIADRVSSLIGAPVKIRENVAPNTFEVVMSDFVGDFSGVTNLLNKIVPAHLVWNYSTEVELQSEIADYYKIIVAETEEFEATMVQAEPNNHTRVADEEGNILLSDDGEVFIF